MEDFQGRCGVYWVLKNGWRADLNENLRNKVNEKEE